MKFGIKDTASLLSVIVFFYVAYLFFGGASLSSVRSAREGLLKDMNTLKANGGNIVSFDDDKKTKIGSALVSMTISANSWTPALMNKYEATLLANGWAASTREGSAIFYCKNESSAILMAPQCKDEGCTDGYVSMTYPSDLRARCK